MLTKWGPGNLFAGAPAAGPATGYFSFKMTWTLENKYISLTFHGSMTQKSFNSQMHFENCLLKASDLFWSYYYYYTKVCHFNWFWSIQSSPDDAQPAALAFFHVSRRVIGVDHKTEEELIGPRYGLQFSARFYMHGGLMKPQDTFLRWCIKVNRNEVCGH